MKSIQHLAGLERLKPARFRRLRSIPFQQKSAKTELYLLEKEKERLSKERSRLINRLAVIDERFVEMQHEVDKLLSFMEKEKEGYKNTFNLENDTEGNTKWKTKTIKY